MRQYVALDPWRIIEEGYHPETNEIYESLTSLGNGYLGLRGNFEESYSGKSLKGTYIAGVYYPDKTRVGWWKNGYPEYFAKVLNSADFLRLDIRVNNEVLDLHRHRPERFSRVLDMQRGLLTRSFEVTIDGARLKIDAERFTHMKRLETVVVAYRIEVLDGQAELDATSLLDGEVRNQDANYDEYFWRPIDQSASDTFCHLTLETKKTAFQVTTAQHTGFVKNATTLHADRVIDEHLLVGQAIHTTLKTGDHLTITKTITVTNSRYTAPEDLVPRARQLSKESVQLGLETLRKEQIEKWEEIWDHADILIDGDVAAQQGIRFNIFHLKQTYTGDDPRLNIGPKGFTGEKYGGSTYWDTEAYCLPFYMSTSGEEVAKNLLIYRHNHLEKAVENAGKLGLGGALYPMVTMNGEESHNEWEITFEEIHRNAAIAYAIYNYERYTGNDTYLFTRGLDVLVEISRFWRSRVNYVPQKDVYMILGVTGPNEYENNVNNNWYTNRMATWCLTYTLEVLDRYKTRDGDGYTRYLDEKHITPDECTAYRQIIDKMYYPVDETRGIFLQQDGFLDKDLTPVNKLAPEHLPLNQNWSWDRILRSCYIKQADVLQGLFFLSHQYDLDTKKRNYDFYEPLTVHESSLSPCIYSIIAADLSYEDEAYKHYQRSARLDLDNYNNDTEDGLHITSMAGTWMSIVYGFGGLHVTDDRLHLRPFIPAQWDRYAFRIVFRNRLLHVVVTKADTTLTLLEGESLNLVVYGKTHTVPSGTPLVCTDQGGQNNVR